MTDKKKVAIYARVSKDEVASDGSLQNPDNQIEPLKKFAKANEWEIEGIYIDRMSGAATNRPSFKRIIEKASIREIDHILVWSLDRFSREGIANTLSYVKKLKSYKVGLTSLQERWLNIDEEGVSELLLALWSWIAKEERRKISERTKAGLKRVKADGQKLGRPKGSKDKNKRRRSGYYIKWSNKKRG